MKELIVRLLLFPLGCFSGPSIPATPLPAPAPQQADASVAKSAEDERRRKRAAASNTVLTSPLGIANGNKPQKTSILGG